MIGTLIKIQTKLEAISWYKVIKRVAIIGLLLLIILVIALMINDDFQANDSSKYSGSAYSANYDQVMAYQEVAQVNEPTKENLAFLALIDKSLEGDLEINNDEFVIIDAVYKDIYAKSLPSDNK